MKSKISSVLLIIVFTLAGVAFAKQAPVTDDSITNQVMIKLAGDEIVKGGGLKVDVKEGVVTLDGSVADTRQKDRAAKLAKKVKGVKRVVNKITIRK